MSGLRFSIANLLAAVTVIGVGLAALNSPSDVNAGLLLVATLAALLAAALGVVYREGDSTLVTVVQGQVDVTHAHGQAQAAVDAVGRRVRVSAGEQLRIRAGVLPASPTRVDIQRSTAWLRRELAFEQQPLSVVAAEFNRYGALPIEIETPALRTLTVSGVFAADDTDSFIAFLRSLEGVGVEVTSTRIRVFGLSPPTPAEPTTTR